MSERKPTKPKAKAKRADRPRREKGAPAPKPTSSVRAATTKPKATPKGVVTFTAPAIPTGSMVRRKRALLDELKSQDITPEQTLAARVELDTLQGVPILSHHELERLDG